MKGPHLRLRASHVSSEKGLRLVNDKGVVRSLLAMMIRQAVEDIIRKNCCRTEEDIRTAVWFLGHCQDVAAYINLNYNRTVAALLHGRNLWEESQRPWVEPGTA